MSGSKVRNIPGLPAAPDIPGECVATAIDGMGLAVADSYGRYYRIDPNTNAGRQFLADVLAEATKRENARRRAEINPENFNPR